MSKKKSSLTMTLKDFHGGSIPSQLSLPSAPASSNASARPPDRPGAWGTATAAATGRSDLHHHHLLRPRPGSAGAASTRSLDDRPPVFLSHSTHIGRHFDEDERKPFDASSAPRRAPAPENAVRSPPPRSDSKRPLSSPVVPSPIILPAPVSAFPPPSTNLGPAPSAWGPRKEVGIDPQSLLPAQPAPTVWSASRLAQASAVEKVTSGRWQLRPPEVEIIRSQESEELDRRFVETVRVVDGIDSNHERDKPRSVSYPVTYAEGKERTLLVSYMDRARSPVYPDMKEKNAAGFLNESVRPTSGEGKFDGTKLYQQVAVEVSERPKLKLLPRKKTLESPDIQTWDLNDKQVYHAPASLVQVQNVHEMHGITNPPKLGSAGIDEGNQIVERPKLNLKPRTQPIDQSDGNADRERQSVFGGARPREQVLKERGIDIAPNDLDLTMLPNRTRNDLPRTDSKMEPNAIHHPGEKSERTLVGQGTGKDLERKAYRPDMEKLDMQRSSWRNDNRKNARENGKPLEPPRADTDNWRKPVEQPKPDNPTPRIGKAASALELAQAFSKSVSDDKPENHFTSQRSIPGQTQLPFSRLTDTRELYSGPAHRQINGY
ncbi:hypothetical protein Cni_G16391 [Canna indica]|uniref:Uncharacterized protein n=1 Tax=Canna indica TaxID=4628 RepID=A0AAQ3KKX3_9LILI|nr:hypothetical protein Cni_G16391 [Canna indica]